MALKLVVNIAKKVPGPAEFSSIQASCSIEGEIAVGQDPVAEAARLYGQIEQAVDRQLGITSIPQPTSPRHAPTYPSTNRRSPVPISAAQLRFLRQLCDRTPGAMDRILADQRIASIELLSSRAASGIIDQLKGAAP
jgi:hypothetical protein